MCQTFKHATYIHSMTSLSYGAVGYNQKVQGVVIPVVVSDNLK